jgi:nitroreductase
MEILDAIYRRRAVRSFQKTPVGEDLLRKLLDVAVQGPSATTLQPWARRTLSVSRTTSVPAS